MEVANPSYAYVTGPRNIYKDRVKIERHQNPLCSKIEEESKYLKSYSCDSKLQDARESGQHPVLRQEISQSENSRHEAQKQESKHSSHSSNLPSLLDFNLYGYQPTNKEHLFNSSGQASAHRYKDDAYSKIESDVSKQEQLDSSSGTCKNGDSEPNHDHKQASVIMEPRGGSMRDLQSDIYRHGSITLGTAGSSLHRARSEASHSFGIGVRQSGFICSTEGNHNTLLHSGSKSVIGSPLSTSVTRDQKHGLNLTSSPKPIQAGSAGMLNVGTVTKDRINPWLAGGKEQQYELWREAVHQKNSVANLSHQKLANFPTQNISSVSQLPSSDHHLVTFSTCSLIQQGLVPNPMYISSAISMSGASSTLAPSSAALHRSNHSHMMVPTLCTQDIAKSFTDINASVKRRPKKEINGSGMKKSRLDSNESRFPVSKPASMINSSLGDSATNLSTSLSGNSQPAYLDSFKSFVDHAVQNAFLQDKDVETDQSSSVREKMRQLIASEPGTGDDATREFGISTVDNTALAATQEPEKEFACETVAESGERSSPYTPTSVAVVTMAPAPSVPLAPIPTVQSQQQMPVSAPSPGCASLSSLSSLAENVNRGRSAGCVDTDSDTLSAHSPSVAALPKSASTPPPSGSAPLSSIHHKFHRKAWLHHYLNEDKKKSSPCSFAVSSKLVQQSDNKADGAVRGCYISLSYMSKDAQSQSPVKVTKDSNLPKNEDLEDSEGAGVSR